eukprot:748368-Hanusia_phi.AAC.1
MDQSLEELWRYGTLYADVLAQHLQSRVTSNIPPASCLAPPGYFCSDNAVKQPQECKAGSYCEGGEALPWPCPKGYYCPAASHSPRPCPRGRYCMGEDAAPAICPAGFYCLPYEGGSSSKMPCPEGFFCQGESHAPEKCTRGHYCEKQAKAPVRCPSGHFCATGASMPQVCKAQWLCDGEAFSSPYGHLGDPVWVLLLPVLVTALCIGRRHLLSYCCAMARRIRMYLSSRMKWNRCGGKEQKFPERHDHKDLKQVKVVYMAELFLSFLGQIEGVEVLDYSKFSRIEHIASGSHKLVYKAVYNHPQAGATAVALLQMRRSRWQPKREDVVQEVRIFKHIGRHEHFLDLLGIAVDPASGDIYLITDFAPRGSLDQLLKAAADNDLTVSPLVQLEAARQICSGMAHLAMHQVFHRDLAARNVLIFKFDPKNHHNGVHLKIADYSLAVIAPRAHGEWNGSGSQTSAIVTASSTACPIRWMAPESMRSNQYSEKSDVWAFAVTLWEIWTYGEVPYGTIADDDAVEQIVVNGDRLPLPDVCPPGVYEIMLACWRQREERPSFNELRGMLGVEYDKALAKSNAGAGRNEDRTFCIICLDQEAHWAILPCGHLCLCGSCKQEDNVVNPCPVCRKHSIGVLRIYHA